MTPPFKKVAILGVGLIGGSLGLALRDRSLAREVCGWGRREERLRKAVEIGALDTATLELGNAVGDADLAVLCAPVPVFDALLRQVAVLAKPGCVVTDAGSVKGTHAARWARMAKPLDFVPAHPMAGSEKSGVEAARADLFEGSVCILTPFKTTPSRAAAKVSALWSKVGCRVRAMDAKSHDRVIGAVSHLPHAAAFSLVRAVDGMVGIGDYALAGKGYRDATRVGGSDPELWADILMANRGNVGRGLKKLARELAVCDALLEQGDRTGLVAYLGKASRIRGAL